MHVYNRLVRCFVPTAFIKVNYKNPTCDVLAIFFRIIFHAEFDCPLFTLCVVLVLVHLSKERQVNRLRITADAVCTIPSVLHHCKSMQRSMRVSTSAGFAHSPKYLNYWWIRNFSSDFFLCMHEYIRVHACACVSCVCRRIRWKHKISFFVHSSHWRHKCQFHHILSDIVGCWHAQKKLNEKRVY